MMQAVTEERVWEVLDTVADPEIPVVSVVEMGLIRAVTLQGDWVAVTMTPTFSGCPALEVMQRGVITAVSTLNIPPSHITVHITLSPPWTTDWMTDEARAKLKAFGLSPPPQHGGKLDIIFHDIAPCPRCDSHNTSLKNSFGPTLCRAIYYCHNCQEPFEQFKPL